MQETILYGVVAITLGAFFIPAMGVLVQVAQEATRSDWLEAIPGIGLLLSLSVKPIDLDWGTAGAMFFVLLLLKSRKKLPQQVREQVGMSAYSRTPPTSK
jgi:hypothetical protein